MNAKHWLLSGFGCIAVGVLGDVALGLYWLGQVRSFAGSRGTTDPTEGFGIVMVGGALATLLFIGGAVVLIIGFIQLAKEPRSGAVGARPRGGDRQPADPRPFVAKGGDTVS
jgi:hypothetical protein